MGDKYFYMKLAIQLAESVVGQTSPNPAVGCVVVKNGQILGMGAHMKAGEPHAEVNALKQAGERAEGADLYVTLEPCSHTGRTPPCADLIIEKKIRRVFIAGLDPNPVVAGNGVAKLQKAGISVEYGIYGQQAEDLNKFYFHFIKTRKPFTTLKTAVTFDGKTAASSGDSKWITSDQARLDVHHYRHRHDAILVGINTVIQDNPHLTTRLPQGGKNPIRIVLDTHLRIPMECNLLNDNAAPTIIVCGKHANEKKRRAIEEKGVKVKKMPSEKIEIEPLLNWLGKEQILSVFVEGGSAVHSAFIDSGFFQEIVMYMAPKLLNDRKGTPAFGGVPKQLVKDSIPLAFKSVEQIGPDIKLIVEPVERGK
ncbi:bifunctional diaminohydroxyphosphoribosylaminopyrimidine deaminase/5-amino-6-(5-phosphoribosylamino)uracil reductase RibD [Siminovitchia fortis]|uniref:bifunctional diaminohydroxyphosphoribosylaminopyrimidine deaminase/5-amino-6-(5-phosphoribosylamino)uracil reductase RibD n=1 Tax=Siminovitchia fortis TaxID=254758 RepID=UPI00119F76FE|nr:bifunctional diaminohydroxyphosphoribosylaminopyrimidine deaminase/5-amino-6-(5-phosphoribosylamino)uracil reductase RibD [Siminovitchia fortis]